MMFCAVFSCPPGWDSNFNCTLYIPVPSMVCLGVIAITTVLVQINPHKSYLKRLTFRSPCIVGGSFVPEWSPSQLSKIPNATFLIVPGTDLDTDTTVIPNRE